MQTEKNVPVSAGWRIVLLDLGLDIDQVLRSASLPADLFNREKAMLTPSQYFELWRAIDSLANDPLMPLKIGSGISVEAFDPPLFAALCSENLSAALKRIGQFKKLCGPMELRVKDSDEKTEMTLTWLYLQEKPPRPLVLCELVFFVQLARLATRTEVKPLAVYSPELPEVSDPFKDYFGREVQQGEHIRLVFCAKDANMPFVTANAQMWQVFEPELQRRLSELDRAATTATRTRAALVELLPSGAASVDAVSSKLGTSKRTLQRRLEKEGMSFQKVLNDTRKSLAFHYLKDIARTNTEIAFLLGFDDPNSFFRAFQTWTGQTPAQKRVELLAG